MQLVAGVRKMGLRRSDRRAKAVRTKKISP